jgi:hypothetical protein
MKHSTTEVRTVGTARWTAARKGNSNSPVLAAGVNRADSLESDTNSPGEERSAAQNGQHKCKLSFRPMDNHRALEAALTIVEIRLTGLELRFGFRGLARTKPRALLRLNGVFPACG